MNSACARFCSVSEDIVVKRRGLVGEQDDQRLLEDVVVQRAEELHAEERPEAPLGQQPELTTLGHYLLQSVNLITVPAVKSCERVRQGG